MKRIMKYFERIEERPLRVATMLYLKLHWPKFSSVPASITHHNTHDGGLLDHTLEVVDFGISIIEALGFDVNVGHYVVAALLHDMGKVDRYHRDGGRWTKYGRDRKVSIPLRRHRIDHSLKPILDFEVVTNVPLPMGVKLAILSHMGGWSVTSVYPDSVFSAVLHSADLISSRMVK